MERRWLLNAGVWLGIGLFEATQTVFAMRFDGMHHAWLALFAMLLLSYAPWMLATPGIFILRERVRRAALGRLARASVHVVAWTTIAVLTAAWIAALETLLNPMATSPFPPPFRTLWEQRFVDGVFQWLFLYWAVLVIGQLFESRERQVMEATERARLNELLSKAELQAVRQQIEPHFLFNALNAVTALVRERRNEAAISVVADLSDCLRHVLYDAHRHRVPLGEEVAFAERFLAIQKVRFADTLAVEVDVPGEIHHAQVPSLLLQPIVENSIKHGIAQRARGGLISISARRLDDVLTLRVYNDGPCLPAGWERNHMGIGLTNVLARLKGVYGQRFRFDIANQGSEGVEVVICIPFRVD